MLNYIEKYKIDISDSIAVKSRVLSDVALLNQVALLAERCVVSLENGGKVIFAGNGGSFADAQHLSAEFTSRLQYNRKPLASIALGANSSSMSAIGNDYGFENIFSRELEGIANIQDIFIPITTSGKSTNIIHAARQAADLKVITVCLTGGDAGDMKDICECITIPSKRTERIQECHIMIGHILCAHIEDRLFNRNNSFQDASKDN